MNKIVIVFMAAVLLLSGRNCLAQSYSPEQLKTLDTDRDGLSDYDELSVFRTDPLNRDTDGDEYTDGDEALFGYDPNQKGNDKIEKHISVDLNTQTLVYSLGKYDLGSFKISSGLKKTPTPAGEFEILKKLPAVTYKGVGYNYPNTKWNLLFKQQKVGNLYIHGAYWHNNFGKPASHGCVNVSYANMEALYNWADVGTKVNIY